MDVSIHTSKPEVQNKVQLDFNALNILIVEDEETNFSYLNTLLRKVGAKSDLARDGKEAIEMTEMKEYDLILMDLKMPVMDGFEATRQIRSKNEDVFIIAQSAYTQSEEKERALEAGCNDYIVKPIRIDDFYNVINQVTKRKTE
jgi:CheY-like chemotaxis protein